MNRLSVKNIFKLSQFDFRNNKKGIIGWCIAIFSIMFLYMILFSSMQDMAMMKMEAMPDELLKFMGMEDITSMANYIGYYSMIYNLILIAISIFAATFSAKILAKEEKLKSIEFLYSLPTSRVEIFISKIITSFVAVLLVVLAGGASAILCGFINGGDTFVLMDLLQILKVSSFTAFFFSATALFVTGITTKIGVSTVSALIVVASYMLGYLSTLLVDKAKWLKYLSPFVLFSPDNTLNLSDSTITNLVIYFVIFIALYVVGAYIYKKRDYNI